MDGLDRARERLRVIEPVVFLACAFVVTLLLARSFPIQSDEGYTLNGAWQLWTGLKMYDDFRLFVGPGSGYAVYAIWRAAGSPSFLAARLVSLALSFWGTTGLYLLLRRLGTRGVSRALGLGLWLAVSSLYVLLNHNSFSAFAAIWFLLALVRTVQARSAGRDLPRDYVLVGLAAGAVFLFLPIKGSLLVACAVAFLVATAPRPRRPGPALGVAGGFAVAIAPLFLKWSPITLVRNWLIVPLTGNYLGHTSASAGYAVAAGVVVAVMGWAALKRRDQVLQALACVQAALFVAMTHNMESSHFAINVFPAIVFATLVLRPAVIAPVLALSLVWVAAPGGAGFLAHSVLRADLLSRRPPPTLAQRVARAHAIYAGPFLPGVYYLLRKPNPFFVSETVVCNDECQQRLVAQLELVKPEIAFLDYQMISHLKYPQTGPVDVYLRDHYVPCPGEGIPVRAIDRSWCP